MPQITLKIIGGKEFKRALDNSPQIAGDELSEALNSTASKVQLFARQYAPNRTGALARSIGKVSATVRKLLAVVGTNLFYAPYQEFGTGIYVGKGYIYPKRAKMLRFKLRGGRVVYARRVKGSPPTKFMQRAKQDGEVTWRVESKRALENITHRLATE